MTSRKKTPIEREAEASVALDGETQTYDPAAQLAEQTDEMPEDAQPVYTYAERYELAVGYLRDMTNGTFESVEDELLAVFPRGEFTAFVYRRTVIDINVPEMDEETEAMPSANTREGVILQTSAKFMQKGGWSHGTGPRTSLLQYTD